LEYLFLYSVTGQDEISYNAPPRKKEYLSYVLIKYWIRASTAMFKEIRWLLFSQVGVLKSSNLLKDSDESEFTGY